MQAIADTAGIEARRYLLEQEARNNPEWLGRSSGGWRNDSKRTGGRRHDLKSRTGTNDRQAAGNRTKPGRVLPVRKRRNAHPEADEQAKVIERAHRAYRHALTCIRWFAGSQPERRRRNVTTTRHCQGQGMLKGVPDLFLPVPRGNTAGSIEMARRQQADAGAGAVCAGVGGRRVSGGRRWSAAEAIAVIQTYWGE